MNYYDFMLMANSEDIIHYGVLGMHWGIRRYQPYPKGYNGKGKYTGKLKYGSDYKINRYKSPTTEYIKKQIPSYIPGVGLLYITRLSLLNNRKAREFKKR